MSINGMYLSECISKTVMAMGNLKTDLKSSLNYLSVVLPPFFTYCNPYRDNFEFKISQFLKNIQYFAIFAII